VTKRGGKEKRPARSIPEKVYLRGSGVDVFSQVLEPTRKYSPGGSNTGRGGAGTGPREKTGIGTLTATDASQAQNTRGVWGGVWVGWCKRIFERKEDSGITCPQKGTSQGMIKKGRKDWDKGKSGASGKKTQEKKEKDPPGLT